MGDTTIEWTDKTWNPVRGCSRVSEGCRNCYAERQAARFRKGDQENNYQGDQPFHGFVHIVNGHPAWTGKVELVDKHLLDPLKWRKPQRVFVNSMSDLFHEALPDEAIDRVFAVMALCPQHTFQILTKRPERMLEYFKTIPMGGHDGASDSRFERVAHCIRETSDRYKSVDRNNLLFPRWPLPNVWLGVSVEDKQRKSRIDFLRETDAAVRFLSIEPLLEDIGEFNLTGIDWVIVGGESGPGARPFDIAWARNTVEQCSAAGVACFVKQLGAFPVMTNTTKITADETWDPLVSVFEPGGQVEGFRIELDNRKGGNWDEWPADLRVREFPTGAAAK